MLIFAVALWVFPFIKPNITPFENLMPISQFVNDFLKTNFKFWYSFSLLLLCAEAFMLYFIFEKHDILTGRTYLPSVVYITLMSCAPLLTSFHPILLANFFLIWALDPLISLYRNDEAYPLVFNISLLFGLASMCYLPTIILFPIIWIGLFIFHPFNFREWIISLIGISIPFWFLFVYYFWNNELEDAWYKSVLYPLMHSPRPKPIKNETIYLVISLLLLSALSTSKVLEHLGSTSVKTSKVMSFLFWFIVFGFLSSFLIPTWTIRDFTFMSIPLAVFIGNYLNLARAKWLAELLFGFLLFALLFLRFS